MQQKTGARAWFSKLPPSHPRSDGLPGFFRGTTATLLREVPFYVAGMMIYEQIKKGVRKGAWLRDRNNSAAYADSVSLATRRLLFVVPPHLSWAASGGFFLPLHKCYLFLLL